MVAGRSDGLKNGSYIFYMVVLSERIKKGFFLPRPNFGGHFGGAGTIMGQRARKAPTTTYLPKICVKLTLDRASFMFYEEFC